MIRGFSLPEIAGFPERFQAASVQLLRGNIGGRATDKTIS
jgi:hypothetical protein